MPYGIYGGSENEVFEEAMAMGAQDQQVSTISFNGKRDTCFWVAKSEVGFRLVALLPE
ncbi:MAG: hypothetical protein R2828_27635 [Saprospiraceae bacterium]